MDHTLEMGMLDRLADLNEQFEPASGRQLMLVQKSVIGDPATRSMT